MYLSPNIKFCRQAGEEWLTKKLAKEEASLPDYDRPIGKVIFPPHALKISRIAEHGFISACFRYMAP